MSNKGTYHSRGLRPLEYDRGQLPAERFPQRVGTGKLRGPLRPHLLGYSADLYEG